MATADLTAQRLREVLHYDPLTGAFRWIERKRGRRPIVGCVDHKGYMQVMIDAKSYPMHRLAWLYVYGEWPKDQIDHGNQNKADNRICNLRDVDGATNQQNVTHGRNNKFGLAGVHARGAKFRASIGIRGKDVKLGTFDSADEAHSAYLRAKRTLHPGFMG